MTETPAAPLVHPEDRAPAHRCLIYGSDEEFLASAASFCGDGLARGDAVLAVTTGTNIGLLRRALAGSADRVEFVDAEDWYHRPGATLGAYHRYVDRHTTAGPHRRVRVVGEPVWHGRDALETTEWTRYEAAINVAFAAAPVRILCPYDVRTVSPDVVADAHRTHPGLVAGASDRSSDAYVPPTDTGGFWRRPLAPVPAEGTEAVLAFGADLDAVRTFAADTAAALGAPAPTVQRLVFAVNEVATNAVQHGGGSGVITVRRHGSRIVADVTDRGGSEPAWYVGYLPPDPRQPRGHGMWAVRQLCDLVEVHTDRGTTTVRLHLALD